MAIVAGCSEDGVFIEVRVEERATQVELFIGLEPCTDCLNLTPASSNVPVPGRVLYRDANEPLMARVEPDGSAWFKLAPSPGTEVGMIAIATSDAPDAPPDQPVAVAIVDALDLSLSRHIILETDPAADWDGDEARQPPNGALLWPAKQCVGAANAARQTTFIVTAGDPDCDAVDAALECDPLTYLATQGGEGTACAADATLPSQGAPRDFCVLWQDSTVCVDGVGPSLGCSRTGPVVGPKVCECTQDVGECVRNETDLRIECKFMGTTTADSKFRTCEPGTTSSRPAPLSNASGLGTCITFTGFTRNFSLPPTQNMFEETFLPFPTTFVTLSVFSALRSIPSDCIEGLQWSLDGLADTVPSDTQFFAWIRSNLVDRPLLVPMQVTWEESSSDCTVPPTCTLVGDVRIAP
jgi:hypothetical protein